MDVEIENYQIIGNTFQSGQGVGKEKQSQGRKFVRKVPVKSSKSQGVLCTPLNPICENKGAGVDGGKRKLAFDDADKENREGVEGSAKKMKLGDRGIGHTSTWVVETDHNGSPMWI